jgi:hypothetical protein
MDYLKNTIWIALLSFYIFGCSVSPYQKAILENDIKRAQQLEKEGSSVHETYAFEYNTLSLAVHYGNLKFVKHLVSKGVDTRKKISVLKRDSFLIAAFNAANAKMVIQQNKKVFESYNIKRSEGGEEWVAIMDYLASTGKIDVNAVDNNGETALFYATRKYKGDLVKYLLLTLNADPDIKTNDGYTAESLLAYNLNRDGNTWNDYQKQYVRNLISLLEKFSKIKQEQKKSVSRKPKIASKVDQAIKPSQPKTLKDEVVDKAVDTVADCLKLHVALQVCEKLPWPVSIGCEKLTKAKFDNIVCKVIK